VRAIRLRVIANSSGILGREMRLGIGTPTAIIQVVRIAGLEGVIAKLRDSVYQAGAWVNSGLKLKLDKSHKFVIGGYQPEGGSSQGLLTRYYENRKLLFSGNVGNGCGPLSRASLMKMMQPLITAISNSED